VSTVGEPAPPIGHGRLRGCYCHLRPLVCGAAGALALHHRAAALPLLAQASLPILGRAHAQQGCYGAPDGCYAMQHGHGGCDLKTTTMSYIYVYLCIYICVYICIYVYILYISHAQQGCHGAPDGRYALQHGHGGYTKNIICISMAMSIYTYICLPVSTIKG